MGLPAERSLVGRGRLARLCALLLASGALSGCVAAALPVVATGVMAKQVAKGGGATHPDPAAAPVAAAAPAPTSTVSNAPDISAVDLVVTNRAEDFMTMALFALDTVDNGQSVIANPVAREGDAVVLPCAAQRPAILIDLDPGNIALPLGGKSPRAAPGLAVALATARARGIAVLWTSVLDEARSAEVRAMLAATGLDRVGQDELLLTRDPAESKTRRRAAASGEWCIKAIAGDQRGDFDELMNYLRDSEAPTPFDSLIDKGWFELPPPIEYAD